MEKVINSLGYLFDRPNEPIITPKGENKALFNFDNNKEFLPDEYKDIVADVVNRFGDSDTDTIPLVKLASLPKLEKAKQLGPEEDFSVFLPKHQDMAAELIDVLMSVPENKLQEFLSTCVYCRANLNSQLFNYAFCVVLMHRKDTRNVPIQNFAETFPSKFVDSQKITEARKVTTVFDDAKTRMPIIIPRDYTASNQEIEHRLAYFREDIGINLHHWHWHMVYPFKADRSIVAKDRRGELFYYMHHEIIARYNSERLDNALMRVEKLSNWRDPIPEAYFPKLDSLTSSRGWPPRQANCRWQDVNRPADGAIVTISQMENWKKNIDEAISSGFVTLPDLSKRSLDIDTLGNMLESSILSPNPAIYGSLHNSGHIFSAYIHDPDHRYLEGSGVIGDEAITMRDPLFYRWHAWIDDLFQQFKENRRNTPPYLRSELEYKGVQITSAFVKSESSNGSGTDSQNVFNTFWMQSDVDLSRGIDFSNRGPVYARFTHLNHIPFTYTINVNNNGPSRRGTVRIFLAPKNDERQLPWLLNDQRKMFFQLDRFVVLLNSGQNTITRRSIESSVTIPFEQTFRDLSIQGDDTKKTGLAAFNFCGCGWPQHMLIPRGTESGSDYQLFIMVSNYDFDKVEQPNNAGELSCDDASSYCGLRDKLYPDKRAMGFPFDRPSTTANVINDFILPNMALVECKIILNNKDIVQNPKNPKLETQS